MRRLLIELFTGPESLVQHVFSQTSEHFDAILSRWLSTSPQKAIYAAAEIPDLETVFIGFLS